MDMNRINDVRQKAKAQTSTTSARRGANPGKVEQAVQKGMKLSERFQRMRSS